MINNRMELQMEYYTAIKKNAFLPFAAIWLDVENITL